MKPSDLYQQEPEKTDGDLSVLFGCYYNHMPEVADWWPLFASEIYVNTRIQVRYYKDHNYDTRRIWRLASVWLDNEPFMVIQNAGREGDDHSARFITNVERYKEAVTYVRSILPPRFESIPDVVAEDEDIPNLTAFYSATLETVGGYW